MDSKSYTEKAMDFTAKKDLGSAKAVLEEARTLFPNDAHVMFDLAQIYKDIKERESADELYDSLRTMSSSIPDYVICYNAALIKFLLEKYPEALELFRKYSTIVPLDENDSNASTAKGFIAECLEKMTEGNSEYVQVYKKIYAEGKARLTLNCQKQYEKSLSLAIQHSLRNDITINKESFYETLHEKNVPKEVVDTLFESLQLSDYSYAYVDDSYDK
jgi:tetratricopeptide (TPR) repeat protein